VDFGIELLNGGNIEIQKTIYDYFLNNKNSEVFFLRMDRFLKIEKNNIEKGIKTDNNDQTLKILRFL
jgi:hypothetical protein